jgi:hypothetical protein
MLVLPLTGLPLIGQALFWIFWAFAASWILFIGTRFWKYVRGSAVESGKQYENDWRYKLPPEYADSEDAWAAAERRRNSSGKGQDVRGRKP